MAKHNSIFGGKMSGSVDNLTAYVLEGKGIIRHKPLKRKNPNTDAQKYQRAKWKGISKVLGAFSEVYELTFSGSQSQKRRGFLKHNLNAVDVDEKFVPTLDPAKILCTLTDSGRRPEVNISYKDGSLRIAQTGLELAPKMHPDDQVYLAIYESKYNELVVKKLMKVVTSGTSSFNLLKGWDIENVYCYAFYISKSGLRKSQTDVIRPTIEE